MAKVGQGASRLSGLDGLRAAAIALVLVAHSSKVPQAPHGVLDELFPRGIGRWGVMLFFLLSGFLMTQKLLREEAKYGKVAPFSFSVWQMWRLVPPLVVYLLFLAWWDSRGAFDLQARDLVPVFLAYQHITYAPDLMAHLWTLSLQTWFFLLWPVVLLALPKSSRGAWTLGLLVAMPLSTPVLEAILGPMPPNWYPAHFFRGEIFMAGALLAWARQGPHRLPGLAWTERHPTLTLLGGFAAGLFFLHLQSENNTRNPGNLALDYLITLMALVTTHGALALRPGWLLTLCASWPVRSFAAIGFSVYLWQQFFFFGYPYHWAEPWIPKSWLSQAFWFPGCIIMAVTAGALGYHVVERPVNWARERWFPARNSGGDKPQPSPSQVAPSTPTPRAPGSAVIR